MRAEQFIQKYKLLINLRELERQTGAPLLTISKVATNERRLPRKHLDSIFDTLWAMVEDMEACEKYEEQQKRLK